MTKIQSGDIVVFRRNLDSTEMLVIDVRNESDDLESSGNNHRIISVMYWFKKIDKYSLVKLNEDEFCLKRR